MANTLYLTARQVRERYQISDMTLWRWLKDNDLQFPKPTIIRSRRYFDELSLRAWDKKQRGELTDV